MAEQPTTSPGVAGPERDVLVATKFHIPPGGFVPRPQLLARLASGIGRGLTLVSTPPGFGKTTLLGDWARRSRRRAVWLSLDAGDNDPARFWRYVATALDRARPGLRDQVAPLLDGPQRPPLEAVATAVINQLAVVPNDGAVALVLDDYHLIDAPSVHDSVTFLLERLPPGLRLVLASRADPPLPLTRLRASGQIAELGAADLRFTLDETAAFLRETTGLDLPRTSLTTLQERTEGWVAGVQLAALSLQGHSNPALFVATFAGSNRHVLDYLTEEVLGRQPEQVVTFLMETSILERLSASLCNAVTGRSDSQSLLEELERTKLFVVPLDDVREWWRYHHLFADLLRARLVRERPRRVRELHRAAAGWHQARGLADEAVHHAVAAGELAWAGRLVEQHVEQLLRRSEGATLGRWLSALPPATIRSRARLCLAQAVSAVVGGRVEAMEPLLIDAERAHAATGEEPHEPSVGRALSVLANVPASIAFLRADTARLRGDAASAVAYDRQALSHLGADDWLLRSHVAWNLGVVDWLRGRLGEAERALSEVVDARRAVGEGYLAMRVAYDLGQVQRAQGRLGAALDTFGEWLDEASEGGSEPPHLAMAHLGFAEVLYERDELPAAHQHATRAVALSQRLAFTQPLASGLGMLARIRWAQGDGDGAMEAMGDAERVELSTQVVPLLNPVPVWRARLLLDRGEVDEVARWVEARGLAVTDETTYPREGDYLVLARVFLATQQHDQAVRLLALLGAQAAAQGRTGSLIEVGALQSRALAAAGDEATALTTLAEALVLAGPDGHVRVFVDEGPAMAQLLGRLAAIHRAGQIKLTAAVPQHYLDELMSAARRDRARGHSTLDVSGVAGPAEPLSARELQVLTLLAAGKSNQEIADELVVVRDTVKKHVGHILDKLGAANRTQAVARARALRLLP